MCVRVISGHTTLIIACEHYYVLAATQKYRFTDEHSCTLGFMEKNNGSNIFSEKAQMYFCSFNSKIQTKGSLLHSYKEAMLAEAGEI